MSRTGEEVTGTPSGYLGEGEIGSRIVEVGDGHLFLIEVQVASSPERVIEDLTAEFGQPSFVDTSDQRYWLIPANQSHSTGEESVQLYRISLATSQVGNGTRARIAIGADKSEATYLRTGAELDEIEIITDLLARTLGLSEPATIDDEPDTAVELSGAGGG